MMGAFRAFQPIVSFDAAEHTQTLPSLILCHGNLPVQLVGRYVPGGTFPMVALAHTPTRGIARAFQKKAFPAVISLPLQNARDPSRGDYLTALKGVMQRQYRTIPNEGLDLRPDRPDLALLRHTLIEAGFPAVKQTHIDGLELA